MSLRRTSAADFSRPQPLPSVALWRERSESMLLAEHAFDLARALDINKLLVDADALQDIQEITLLRRSEDIIWVAMKREELDRHFEPRDNIVCLSAKKLNRTSRIKLSILHALINGYLRLDERIICISGVSGASALDTLLIVNPYRDFSWLGGRGLQHLATLTSTGVFETLIDIALHFAAEGREGRPIGTTFIIGEPAELAGHCHQMMLNPLHGHPAHARSVLNRSFHETLRELAALDGALIINQNGIVQSAGTYISVPAKRIALRSGLGARHAAAASLSA
ncbi:MAG TPA: diadenylate cyclase, partial [Oligoflexia bacterium]|nr:diadenylate cyclase [Oligoflexia bacterium]